MILEKIWKSKIFCYLFHPKKTKKYIHYIDPVTQRPYGKYKCEVCNEKYLANNKWDWYRLPTKKKCGKKSK